MTRTLLGDGAPSQEEIDAAVELLNAEDGDDTGVEDGESKFSWDEGDIVIIADEKSFAEKFNENHDELG